MIKYSIIIPHYNSPELLMRCLSSIPVSEDIQVIVVDDCSPNADLYLENYPELSRPYLEFYSTGTNGGGGKARNVGLKYAKGTWIIFADADDFFVDNVKAIWNKYYEATEDIIFFNVKGCSEENIEHEIKGDKEILYDRFTISKDESIFRYCYTVPWGKMIKKNLIVENNIVFEEVPVANDFLFSVKTGFYAKNIIISQDYMYWYVIMKNSTCHGKNTLSKKEARLIENIKVQVFLESKEIISNYNLISYKPRLSAFFPIISSQEFKILRRTGYPIWPVIRDRIKLLFNKIVKKDFSLNPNTRVFSKVK